MASARLFAEEMLSGMPKVAMSLNNGGHEQFFYNSTGMLWQQALDGFTMLEAESHKANLQQAVARLPNGHPSTERQRRGEVRCL